MTQTRIADNVAWHIHQEAKKAKKEREGAMSHAKRLDAKFNEWAKRNGIDLDELKVMGKKK